ncbi:MAG: hypothetical protein LC725_03535 [Lentisphaerae bacterium]|nr:hypothetical protein [Lentisphaerota bacterium]
MDDAVFGVRLAPTAPGPSGLDSVEFEFSANPGERLCDLRAVASSGEISRVMLAVKSALAHLDAVPTLVFDEIDVNLGGRAAGVVGNKLRALAERHQVLCITHLPQVAACGAAHYAVRKFTRSGRTMTEVSLLDRPGRLDEIARMLGGAPTAKTMAHAAEMLERGSGKV